MLMKRCAVSAALVFLLLAAGYGLGREWRPLSEDGIHDPDNPSIALLQDPVEALNRLPADSAGNGVNWIRALRDGYIRPRSTLSGTSEVETLDTDILMRTSGGIPRVLFPHKAHTEWLDCSSCHEHLFLSQTGANQVTMGRILEGEFCGTCHGAVAFPLTECNRCHSVP